MCAGFIGLLGFRVIGLRVGFRRLLEVSIELFCLRSKRLFENFEIFSVFLVLFLVWYFLGRYRWSGSGVVDGVRVVFGVWSGVGVLRGFAVSFMVVFFVRWCLASLRGLWFCRGFSDYFCFL